MINYFLPKPVTDYPHVRGCARTSKCHGKLPSLRRYFDDMTRYHVHCWTCAHCEEGYTMLEAVILWNASQMPTRAVT